MEITTGHNDMLKGFAFGKKEEKKNWISLSWNEKLKRDVVLRDTKIRPQGPADILNHHHRERERDRERGRGGMVTDLSVYTYKGEL